MQVTTTITLGGDEYAADLKGNSSELAAGILKVVGGDPDTAVCSVTIQDSGNAGAMLGSASPPAPPPAPSSEDTQK